MYFPEFSDVEIRVSSEIDRPIYLSELWDEYKVKVLCWVHLNNPLGSHPDRSERLVDPSRWTTLERPVQTRTRWGGNPVAKT